MGNSVEFMSKVPENFAKSELMELQQIIEEAILLSPWTERATSQRSEEGILRSTVSEMHKKGYRPITPEEYRECLLQKEKKICLWVYRGDSINDNEVKITLPSTKTELVERVEFIRTQSSYDSDLVLTDADTVPWATTVQN